MAKYNFATLEKLNDGSCYVYFSNKKEKMTSSLHETRGYFKDFGMALNFAKKFTKPIQGNINKILYKEHSNQWVTIKKKNKR